MKPNLRLVFLLCVLAASAVGCSQTKNTESARAVSSSVGAPANDHDAIVAAIQKHLSTDSGINMSVMDMTVNNVNFTGDQAQADAEFHLKQGGTSMNITYKLERHASDWIVLSDTPSGGQFTHPPMDKTHSGTAAESATGPNTTEPLPNAAEFLKNHQPLPPKSQ
jgi:hypothetical protein